MPATPEDIIRDLAQASREHQEALLGPWRGWLEARNAWDQGPRALERALLGTKPEDLARQLEVLELLTIDVEALRPSPMGQLDLLDQEGARPGSVMALGWLLKHQRGGGAPGGLKVEPSSQPVAWFAWRSLPKPAAPGELERLRLCLALELWLSNQARRLDRVTLNHQGQRTRLTVHRESLDAPTRSTTDVLLYHHGQGTLCVWSRWPRTQDFYRRHLGRLLGSPEGFAPREVCSASPLLEEGIQALSPQGIPGLVEVTLRELELHATDDPWDVIQWKGPRLETLLRLELPWLLWRPRGVRRFKLHFRLAGERRPVAVTLRPPHMIHMSRRSGGAIIRDFLLDRGFLRQPQDQATTQEGWDVWDEGVFEAPGLKGPAE